jgi:nitrogenase-associated protein
MATIIFYEKPGCINNTRQKKLLEQAGHTVIAKNLLSEVWSAERLHPFLRHYLVSEWFNRAAPRVKSGEIAPEKLRAAEALRLLLAEPLLIRRPLMEIEGEYFAGFEAQQIGAWIERLDSANLEHCPRTQGDCALPQRM